MPPNNLSGVKFEEEKARRLAADWPLCDVCLGDGYVDATMGQDPYNWINDCTKCQCTGLMEPEKLPESEQLERRWEIKQ